MTIIIGALCRNDDGTPAVVLASDRMVTWANMTEYEHHVPKVSPISGAVVAISGDALAGARIVADVRRNLRDQVATVEDVANGLAKRFSEVRNTRRPSAMTDSVWPPSTAPQLDLFSSEVILFQAAVALDVGNRPSGLPPTLPGVANEERSPTTHHEDPTRLGADS